MQRNNRNRLLNQFNKHVNSTTNNNLFSQNSMINQNPNYSTNDSNFYNKIQLAKLEQIQRAKKIEDMGLTKKELFEQVIDPHKIQKTNKNEIEKDLNKINTMFAIDKTSQANEFIKDLWKKRTNNPYKNVIKKELFDKSYKKYYKDNIFRKDIKDRKELLVHKVIKDIDADELLLEGDYELLNDILEKHNDELKSIYTVSNKNKFKQDFEYTQKYKYRLEYNPKDADELKDFYKKEQNKINKENKMLDEIIDILVEQEELSKDEIDKINKKLIEVTKPTELSSNINSITNSTTDTENLTKELKEEFGEEIDEIVNEILNDNSPKNIVKKIKPSITSKTITKTIAKTENSDNSVSELLKERYKNRKK